MKHKSTMQRVISYVGKYRLFLVMSLLFALISVASTLYAPVLTGDAIDYMIGEGRVDFEALLVLLVRLGIVIGVTSVSQWLMNLCNNHITFHVAEDVRTEAFDHLHELPLSYVDSHPQGDTVSRMVSDIDLFTDGLLMGFTQFFTGIMTIIGTLFFMLSINPLITLVVVVLTPVSLLVARFIAKNTFKFFKLQAESRGKLTGLIDEMISSQKVVEAFGYGDEAVERFDEISDELAGHSLKATFFSSITNPATRFVNGLVYAGVGITGALSAIHGGISVGQLSCFLSYANQYTKPFNEISSVITEFQNALTCAGRVFEFIDVEAEDAGRGTDGNISYRAPSRCARKSHEQEMFPSGAMEAPQPSDDAESHEPEICLAGDPKDVQRSDYAEGHDSEMFPSGAMAHPRPSDDARGCVDIRDVAFSYNPERELIRDLNLRVEPGQRIAIVGPTGCGKTTLINLLMRFYDVDEGAILVDGVDIRDMERGTLRDKFGMVLQDTWLKSASVHDNIAYAKRGASRAEVEAAAKAAFADGFIRQLPDGYDTVLPEDGGSLSQGQKQLLCIARIMLELPPMLILDEATSSIDTRTEIKIQDAFDTLMEGRTTFIVAHRLSTIENADLILAMKDGRVVEQGTHEELLARGGFYAGLYDSQWAVTDAG